MKTKASSLAIRLSKDVLDLVCKLQIAFMKLSCKKTLIIKRISLDFRKLYEWANWSYWICIAYINLKKRQGTFFPVTY